MRMCVFCMIACAMVVLIKGVQHGIVFPSTLSVTEDVFESWHSLRLSTWLVPTPPLFPLHTLNLPRLSAHSPRFFLHTHTQTCQHQTATTQLPQLCQHPQQAVLSLERRPKRSTKQLLLIVFDMEIFKIAANKQ